MKVLITGSTGMLGRYLTSLYDSSEIVTLGRSESCTIRCDLRHESPDFGVSRFETVIHAAGTIDETSEPEVLNHEGTCRLLEALSAAPPVNFVYVSSHEVYSRNAGLDVGEDSPLWPVSDVGRSKARAESAVEEWGRKNGVIVTIVRPAVMFGDGVHGWAAQLFSDVVAGRYVHIRGNDLRLSLVTAFDVANAIKDLAGSPGVFNISDGRTPTLLQLAEAMSVNAGSHRRMPHLPVKWARALLPLAKIVPPFAGSLQRALEYSALPTLTLSSVKAQECLGRNFHDTIEVISRRAKEYPYIE